MSHIKGEALGIAICGALGIDHKRLQSVTVTCEAGSVAKVEISRLVTDEEAREIATLFEYYKLEKTGEHRQSHPQGMGGLDAVPEPTDAWSRRTREALAQEEAEG